MKTSRRNFLKQTMAGAAAVSVGGILHSFTARSYANVVGANERVKVAMMGVNSRGLALSNTFAKQQNVEIIYVCDVDVRAAENCMSKVEAKQKTRPKASPDFRKALE
ncbi:MAG: twin-arginine translocation signal domain-containing protein, partial [Kiritimatiellae bacterium]|nr:twin-arginine translocation signal domain-containing protein [Kiritimatiellia bacterium]